MNCIPRMMICLVVCAACGATTSEPVAAEDPSNYRIDYVLRLNPLDGTANVDVRVAQTSALLREMSFRRPDTIDGIHGDGEVHVDGQDVRWLPPPDGGSLSWNVEVRHRRNGNGHDAWLGADWGLFRAEDVIPRARSRTLKGAQSETWLQFEMPQGWSVVTQYFGQDRRFRIDNPERRFDQPSGWIVTGELGVRREAIAGTKVAIAGPVGHSIRRMDVLALLNWTLPELERLLSELPPRLTIVSAGDPMWRGGLSAPSSLYMHAERPLISENATSTLLHEVLHIALGLSASRGYDWIVEGLAEYYSLALLERSGSISDERYAQAKSDLEAWSRDAESLCMPVSTGATTARAVMVLFALDKELRDASGGEASLDDVARELVSAGSKVSLESLTRVAESIAGQKPDTLRIESLPGCRTIASL